MVNHPIPSEVASRLRKPKAGHAAIGGELMSPFTLVLGALIAIAMYFLAQRFIYGLGAVTNINNGYPWGIWVVWDVVIATGFACGGYAMALVTYILNKGEYHHLVRPALTASLFGYSLGGLSVLIDLGRYWNFWHILWPGYAQPGSVMFEVAACISCYILVLWIEFSPAFLEHFGFKNLKAKLSKVMFAFIGLGVLLPTMHQSSLGSLLVVFGYQIHPLWQTPLLPLLFLLTAVCMGFAGSSWRPPWPPRASSAISVTNCRCCPRSARSSWGCWWPIWSSASAIWWCAAPSSKSSLRVSRA